MTGDGVGLVTIDAFDGDGHTVDQQLAVSDLHRSEPNLEPDNLTLGLGWAFEIENDGVELWGLCGPTPN